MADLEKRGELNGLPNPFINLSLTIREELSNKYSSTHPKSEARVDALKLANGEITTLTFSRFFRYKNDPETLALEEKYKEDWNSAVHRAIQDDWSGIQNLILEEARVGLEDANLSSFHGFDQLAEELEKDSEWLVNLAR